MTTFAYDREHHITGFQFLFQNGEIKPAFLLVDIQTLTGTGLRTHHLRQLNLIEGDEFEVGSVTDIPTDVLGKYNGRAHGSRRTVLSADGLWQVLMAGRGGLSTGLRRWLAKEVIPGIERDGWVRAAVYDERISEMQTQINHLISLIDGGFGDTTLGDLIGTDL